jgi:hypothetical protein
MQLIQSSLFHEIDGRMVVPADGQRIKRRNKGIVPLAETATVG